MTVRLRGRIGLHVLLMAAALAWLAPLLWAVFTAFRPYDDTQKHGYLSWPKSLTFSNFTSAWSQAQFPGYFRNTVLVAVPGVLITLLFAAAVAFVVSRFSFWWNIPLLLLFTAGNLLPQQVIITPLYRLYLDVPGLGSGSGKMYDTLLGLVLIHVAFQSGFSTFVLANYMKTIPHELTEAALVDGAGVARQFFQIILPLCRPPLAALATLLSIWIYNDFFWAIVLISTGSKMPITSALNNLVGNYFTNDNLLAAGALMTALPTLIIYFLLQRQFISGLTLGSGKG
ncbi:ABC transporter permease [Mangrovactinospora gilvigrisea]|uniref:ABC transporter permease n=1 Tax=Mangrovactinospora gilvigrisea TaxID=1428644 RepID=A0A1J7BJH0_9ACTN|nr:carbohydrate ABC transporter permease [Mangrovactinospora gilvigrisea]OIV38790.1 ABC transporter permease [Mangrovactinospora gilvigrisea]